jgi:hypothetical protein
MNKLSELSFSTELKKSIAFFDHDSPIDNTMKEEWNTDSSLIQHRVPKHVLKSGERVRVDGYRIDLNLSSKISLHIVKGEIEGWICANEVLGNEISIEISQRISSYMGWLFGNTVVIEQILNYTENEVSMDFWKESNENFHKELQKVLKVRHMSKKFGL